MMTLVKMVALSMVSIAVVSCSKGSVGASMGSPDGEGIKSPGPEPARISFSGVDSIVQGDSAYYELSGECTKTGGYTLDTASTVHYTIQNGKLYILDEGDCQARVLTGSSGVLDGTWTTDGTYANFPGMVASEDCDAVNPWNFEITGTIEISGMEMRSTMVLQNFCWAKLSEGVRENGDIYTMVGCDSLTWSRDGKVAGLKLLAFRIGNFGNEVQYRFSSQGKSCTRNQTAYRMPSPETCAQAYQVYLQDSVGRYGFFYWDYSSVYQTDIADEQAYQACIAEAGFPESEYEPGN